MAIINRDTFDRAEEQTIISALISFADEMKIEGCLGGDEIGESIRIGYLHHCHAILRKMTEKRAE